MTSKWSRFCNIPDVAPGPESTDAATEHMRLLAACPHGWVELYVEQGRTPSTPDSPPEAYALCVWGLPPEFVTDIDDLINVMVNDGSALDKVPHSQFVAIARVNASPGIGITSISGFTYALDVGWGVGGAAVFSLSPAPNDEEVLP